MDTLKNPNINFPVMSALGATIVTLMLLIILSNLTKIEIPHTPDYLPPPISIAQTKPPKPPEPVNLEETEQNTFEPEKTVIPNDDPVRQEITPPNVDTKIVGPGSFEILTKPTIEHIQFPVINEYFEINQVDRKPRIIRRVIPIYPFSAKSGGIEGRVVLRFIVDENGFVQKPEVLRAEPEGVFEESALAAIVKYRFKPALINKKPVKCIVIQPIDYKLNQ
jgi:TonB family protein